MAPSSQLIRVFDRREKEMRTRSIKSTTILTDAEVTQVAEGVRAFLGPTFEALARSYGLDLDASVRFAPVAKRCQEERQASGLSIRDMAHHLNVAQYRLKDIEAGHVKRIQPSALHAYVSQLGLRSWYRRWERSNPKAAQTLAYDGQLRARPARSKTRSNNRMQLTGSARCEGDPRRPRS